jgi:hypothetical protein
MASAWDAAWDCSISVRELSVTDVGCWNEERLGCGASELSGSGCRDFVTFGFASGHEDLLGSTLVGESDGVGRGIAAGKVTPIVSNTLVFARSSAVSISDADAIAVAKVIPADCTMERTIYCS